MAHRVAWYTSGARGSAGWPRRWPVEAVNDEVLMAEEVDGGGSLWGGPMQLLGSRRKAVGSVLLGDDSGARGWLHRWLAHRRRMVLQGHGVWSVVGNRGKQWPFFFSTTPQPEGIRMTLVGRSITTVGGGSAGT
jgi:hypothetical protein